MCVYIVFNYHLPDDLDQVIKTFSIQEGWWYIQCSLSRQFPGFYEMQIVLQR
jgi:hypothetical protein